MSQQSLNNIILQILDNTSVIKNFVTENNQITISNKLKQINEQLEDIINETNIQNKKEFHQNGKELFNKVNDSTLSEDLFAKIM